MTMCARKRRKGVENEKKHEDEAKKREI